MHRLSALDTKGRKMTDPRTSLPSDARDETTSVRQGKTLGSMRWVLISSILLVVVALVIAFAVTPMW